ncbi:ATP-binding cassette [Lithospermum erythrorhizon]|uniref:ATP-binding cassette n=1 Tax=Lithospermum erythrorhizon TaxID=34254 RepID=A0AAV3PYV9_LITER
MDEESDRKKKRTRGPIYTKVCQRIKDRNRPSYINTRAAAFIIIHILIQHSRSRAAEIGSSLLLFLFRSGFDPYLSTILLHDSCSCEEYNLFHHGAITIRAFKQEERFFQKNLQLIDTSATPFFHYFAANEWLIQRLETLSAIVLASSALCMVLLRRGTFSSGFISMSLSYGLSLNISLCFSIQNQCTLANHIISVERLQQYMNIPSEAPEIIEETRPPANWPAKGKVEIQDLQLSCRSNVIPNTCCYNEQQRL